MTHMSDVLKNNKAVLILSSMQHGTEVTNEDIRKPEINLFKLMVKWIFWISSFSCTCQKKQALATVLFSKSF